MDHRIVRAVRLIEDEMSGDIVLDAVAATVGLSASRFHHLFRDEVGVPPGVYLRRIRLNAAAGRLQWTQEEAGRIASGLGYASQSSFTHAFIRRFGTTPGRFRADFCRGITGSDALDNCGPVGLREMDAFMLLARRYVGDLAGVRAYWTDFEARLPGGIGRWRGARFMALVHDDPRMTPAGEVRYDCCVTLDPGMTFAPRVLRQAGLHVIRTRPGRYGSLHFRGGRDRVLGAYRLLCDHWLRNCRYTMADDPAIEIQAAPRHHMDPARLELTILVPLD